MQKIMTVFYSKTGENYFPDGIRSVEKGNTAYAAEHIQKAVGGDLFEILPAVPYADNYRECVAQSVQDMKTNARPELQVYPKNLSDYDVIFVCFPCWCGTAPMCVFTLLERYDLTGKKIVPLCTNEGSGMANSVSHIRSSCPGAEVTEGLSVRGHKCAESGEEIGSWAKASL